MRSDSTNRDPNQAWRRALRLDRAIDRFDGELARRGCTKVTRVSGSDVGRLFRACETAQEALCLALLVCLGPRRRAAANLRWRDVDLERGTIRFKEKGGKVITKPIPHELGVLLRAAKEAGMTGEHPHSYVIPMARGQRRPGDRDDRIVYRIIERLGERAGVEVHPHSLRAAFAVQ